VRRSILEAGFRRPPEIVDQRLNVTFVHICEDRPCRYFREQSETHATQIRRRVDDAAQVEGGQGDVKVGGVIQPPCKKARNPGARCYVDVAHIHPLTDVKHPSHVIQRLTSALAQRVHRRSPPLKQHVRSGDWGGARGLHRERQPAQQETDYGGIHEPGYGGREGAVVGHEWTERAHVHEEQIWAA